MDMIDMHDPLRVAGEPDESRVLLSGRFEQDGHVITLIEMRLYNEGADGELGTRWLITSYVRTEADSVEMIYSEGHLGEDPLRRAAEFLAGSLGVSGLVTRSIIALAGGR